MTFDLGSTTDPGLYPFLGPKVFLIPGGETRRETHPFEAPANGLLPGVNSRCISLQLGTKKHDKRWACQLCVLFLHAPSLDLMKHFLFWASISPIPNHLFHPFPVKSCEVAITPPNFETLYIHQLTIFDLGGSNINFLCFQTLLHLRQHSRRTPTEEPGTFRRHLATWQF